ncbi:MAG: penicillin-binding protein activator [Pseudomonadota bacterium]
MSAVKKFHTVFAAAALAITLAACSAQQSGTGPLATASPTATNASAQSATQETATPAALSEARQFSATIALLVPLTATGQTAEIAKRLKQAGELALFEYRNPSLQLVVKDTQGTPDGARAATQAAIQQGAEIIIGPLFAKSVTAAAEIARPAGIPVVGFSNNPAVAGNGVYLLSFLADQEIERVVSHATASGVQRFAGLIPAGTYGDTLQAAFRGALTRNGGLLVDLQRYPPGATGMLARIDDLIEAIKGPAEAPIVPPRADAIFVPGDQGMLPTIGAALENGKLNTKAVRLLGNGGWGYPGIGRTRATHGGWYAAPDPAGFEAFAGKFSQTFGSQPPRIASFAYDGVAIAAALAKAYPKGQRYQPAQMTNASGFTGVDGAVRFSSSGLSERALAVIEVTANGPQIVSPAPASFSRPQAAVAGTANTFAQ